MKRILLVDDDQQVRKVLGLVLRKNGYHVNEADSGVAGLEMARKHLPDLILSDIDMPGRKGAGWRITSQAPAIRLREIMQHCVTLFNVFRSSPVRLE